MVDSLIYSEENMHRLKLIDSYFGKSAKPLAIPGRVLIGEGVLTKICRKSPQQRQFYLFNDIFVYAKILITNKKLFNRHIIPLEEISVENLEDNSQYQNRWLIRTAKKSFMVYAETFAEKREWMAHTGKCVEDLLRKSGKKPPEKHAALWIPDDNVTRCMCCAKTKFSLIVRRHHCRNCGAVVCAQCSNEKLILPHLATSTLSAAKPLRVCANCFKLLTVPKAVKRENIQLIDLAALDDIAENYATNSASNTSTEIVSGVGATAAAAVGSVAVNNEAQDSDEFSEAECAVEAKNEEVGDGKKVNDTGEFNPTRFYDDVPIEESNVTFLEREIGKLLSRE